MSFKCIGDVDLALTRTSRVIVHRVTAKSRAPLGPTIVSFPFAALTSVHIQLSHPFVYACRSAALFAFFLVDCFRSHPLLPLLALRAFVILPWDFPMPLRLPSCHAQLPARCFRDASACRPVCSTGGRVAIRLGGAKFPASLRTPQFSRCRRRQHDAVGIDPLS